MLKNHIRGMYFKSALLAALRQAIYEDIRVLSANTRHTNQKIVSRKRLSAPKLLSSYFYSQAIVVQSICIVVHQTAQM